jgi:hypothetical protein
MDHYFFNSTFHGNDYHSPFGFFKNDIAEIQIIHLTPLINHGGTISRTREHESERYLFDSVFFSS